MFKILEAGSLDISSAAHNLLDGSSLKGYMKATYEEIVGCFGNPTTVMGDKTTVEWDVELRVVYDDKRRRVENDDDEFSIFATIYDWKRNSRHAPEGEYEWHVGGWNKDAVHAVTLAVENYRVLRYANENNPMS